MKKEELDLYTSSILQDFWKFLEAHKIAKEVGGYVLSSRGTKKFYTIVDKETYDRHIKQLEVLKNENKNNS